jgi:hypothetical protein
VYKKARWFAERAVRRASAPKIGGVDALARSLLVPATPLPHLVLFSSVASLVGAAGQVRPIPLHSPFASLAKAYPSGLP